MFYRTCLLLFAGMSALPAFSQSVNFNIVQLGQTGGPVVGDFNADGREDMIVFSSTGTAFHLRISTGYGTYTSAPSYTIPNGERNIGYTVGDFNRDGKLDLAIITNGTSFYEFLGNGDGSFHSPSTHALGFVPQQSSPPTLTATPRWIW